MREMHRRTDDQKQDESEDRDIVTKSESTRPSYQKSKTPKIKMHTLKLGPKTTPTRKSNVRDASKQQRSKREKNVRQVPQARVFADDDTVQTASYIKRQLLNFA